MPAKKKKGSKKGSKKSKEPKAEEEKKPDEEEPKFIDPLIAFPEVEISVILATPPVDFMSKPFLLKPPSRFQGKFQDQHSYCDNKADDYRQIRRGY